jgi:hypothetical protein
VPWIVAGACAPAGALTVSGAALLARRALAQAQVDTTRLSRAITIAGYGQILILLAAAAPRPRRRVDPHHRRRT